VIGKSIKPIPVMLLGVLLARKRYPAVKYLFVLLIVIGVILFMYQPKHGDSTDHVLGWGELLLVSISFNIYMYVCMNVCMYVIVLCPKTGPWYSNSSLFEFPYELGIIVLMR